MILVCVDNIVLDRLPRAVDVGIGVLGLLSPYSRFSLLSRLVCIVPRAGHICEVPDSCIHVCGGGTEDVEGHFGMQAQLRERMPDSKLEDEIEYDLVVDSREEFLDCRYNRLQTAISIYSLD